MDGHKFDEFGFFSKSAKFISCSGQTGQSLPVQAITD